MISRRTLFGLLARWLSPAYDASRRRALIGAAALVSAPAIIKFASLLPPLERARASAQAGIYADLADITRRAFVPRLYVQIYQANPLLASLMQNARPDDLIWLGGDTLKTWPNRIPDADGTFNIPALKTTFSDPAITIAEPVRRFEAQCMSPSET